MRTGRITTCFACMTALLMSLCDVAGAKTLLTADIWPSSPDATNAPERYECPFLLRGQLAPDGTPCEEDGYLATRPSFGIAFSGGGTRSATATLGQLRALHLLELDGKLQYISAVSGGSWTAVPYTFLPDRGEIDDEAFLGPYLPPEALSDETLKNVQVSAMGAAISDASLKAAYLGARIRPGEGGDESYAASLRNAFLKPFGLADNRFVTWFEVTRDRILERNPGRLTAKDFYVPRTGRPFLIAGAAILPARLDLGVLGSPFEVRPLPFDMTPLYVGMPKSKMVGGQPLGGGYVETFAYDSDLQRREPSATRVEIEIETVKNRFTLADMIATSGAAPVAVTGRLGRLGALVFGFPQFSHWPVIESRSWARLDSGDELNHGDGGLLDNLGVMPLLARGVRNIIVFINTETRFAMLGNGEWRIYDDVTNLFQGDSSDSPLNRVVFEDGPARLAELARAYQVLQSQGRPLVHCASYRVRPNPIYNIFTSYEPNICWVYLDRSRAWLETLDRNGATEGSMLAHLLVPDDIFQNIPHYRTFFENLEVRRLLESAANGQIDKSDFIARFRAFKDEDLRIIKLYPEQVVGLSQLTAWTVCESAQVLSAHMPEVFENASTSCRDQ